MTRRFKQSEIEKIPKHWNIVTLGDVAESISITHDFSRKETIIFINTGDILEGKFLHKNYSEINSLPGQAKKTIEPHDILFSEIRPVNKRYAFVDFNSTKDYVVSTKLMVIRAKGNILPHFLYRILTNNQTLIKFQHIAESRSGTFPQITFDSIKNHLIPIPPISEQRAIAKILYDLDEKIELNRQMNKTLESIAQAIFKHWFIDFEFPDEEGKPYRSSGSEMVDSELGEIPKAWKVNKIKDVVADRKYAIVDGPFGTQLHSDEYVSEGVPVIRITNLTYEGRFISKGLVFITEDKFNSLKRSAVYPGDILLAKTGATIGKLSMMPGYIEKALIASSILKISPNQNNRYYLYNIIRNLSNKNYWDKISAGSTRSTVNLIDIKDIPIIIPDSRLLRVFENLLNNFYFIIENNEKQNQNLTQIRDSLLPKLINGTIKLGGCKVI